MAHGDDPADRYNHRSPAERDHERPIDGQPEATFEAPSDETSKPRGVVDGPDERAGAGGAPDQSAGMPGGTLGTGGSFREQDV